MEWYHLISYCPYPNLAQISLYKGCQRFCICCRHKSGKGEKPTILNTLTTVGVWNSNIFYLTTPIPISLKFRCPPYIKVSIAFVVGTRVGKETNQLSLILWLQLEYGMVTSYISLHLPLFGIIMHSHPIYMQNGLERERRREGERKNEWGREKGRRGRKAHGSLEGGV